MTSIAPSSNNTVIDPNGINKMNQAISDGAGQFKISDNTTVDIKSVGFFKSIQNFFARRSENMNAAPKTVSINLEGRNGQVFNPIQFTIGKATLKKQQELVMAANDVFKYYNEIKTILNEKAFDSKKDSKDLNAEDLSSLQRLQNNLELINKYKNKISFPSEILQTIQEAEKNLLLKLK